MPFNRLLQYLNTIQAKLILGLAIFLLPIAMLAIFNSMYFNGFVREQIAKSNLDVTTLFLNKIDSSLNDIDQYLVDLAMETRISPAYTKSSDDNAYALAVISLSNKINRDILLYRNVDSFFVFLPGNDEMIYALNSRAPYSESLGVNRSITGALIEPADFNPLDLTGWQTFQPVDKNQYLLRVMKAGSAYVGAWIKSSTLQQSLVQTADYPVYILVDGKGAPMSHEDLAVSNGLDLSRDLNQNYLTGDLVPFLVVGQTARMGDFGLAAAMPYSLVFSSNSYIQQVLLLLVILLAVLLPIYLIILRKVVVVPLKHILKTTRDIRGGDLETRILPIRTSREFNQVNHSFNDMLDQIHHLKIDIYEQKISRHRMAIERLQLQVKPHFFLNALSILNTLARTRKYDLMIEMNHCLINYFRYMFRSNMTYVSLRDEIKHVENYSRIQELRFPGQFMSEIEIDDYLLDLLIPPLLIHTFIENTVKYAVAKDTRVVFSVIGVIESEVADGKTARIRISDSGQGFAPHILDKLKSGQPITDDRGEHIGISNLRQRLDHFYRGKASLVFGNRQEGGAMIEIDLPADLSDISPEVV